MLCQFHHRELHKGVFSIKTSNSELEFKTAKGKSLGQTVFPQFPKLKQADSVTWFAEQYPDIDVQTAVSRWQGEKMDYDMAFAGMGLV